MGEAKRVKQVNLQNGIQPCQPQQVRVDLSKATQRLCACGCQYFTPAVTVHIVSALLSPTGQELPVQVPALVCLECKERLLPDGSVSTM